MPLEPLEFLSALLLWSATVAVGFRRRGKSQVKEVNEYKG